MIHIITINPFIENRNYGTFDENHSFTIMTSVFRYGGLGCDIAAFLKPQTKDVRLYGYRDNSASPLSENADYWISDITLPYRNTLIDADKVVRIDDKEPDIDKTYLTLLLSRLSQEIKANDIVIIADTSKRFSKAQLSQFIDTINQKAAIVILNTNKANLTLLKEHSINVVCLKHEDIDLYMQNPAVKTSQLVKWIRDNYQSDVSIVMYPISVSRLLVLNKDQAWLAENNLEFKSDEEYLAALNASLAYSALHQEDAYTVMKRAVAYMSGAALSSGIDPIQKAVLKQLMEKVKIYPLK